VIDRSSREYLLDVSRLIWRLWEGKLPTGIDRVCLEYVRQFGSRSFAVLQFRGGIWVLAAKDSDRLFALLLRGSAGLRQRLIALLATAWLGARRSPPRPGMLYLNVGHTGLHDRALPAWITAREVKAVYLVHDLIPITHPQFCREGEAEKHASRMENALVSGAGIIANSQATLDDLAAFASTRDIGLPDSIVAWIAGSEPTQSEPFVVDRPYFVIVGTIEGRKNHMLLLEVWKQLIEEMGDAAPILVIVGQRGWKAEAAEALLESPELRAHVRELGTCSDAELGGWLKGARALLMPSFAEGFGLPVIEALQGGTPVIAGHLPVYREVVGDIPLYLDQGDGEEWKSAISSFISDCPERERQNRAIEGFRAPDWPAHFAAVELWLEQQWPARSNHPGSET
jgi:glycosyltransferase involved in cell wall biosynthesis